MRALISIDYTNDFVANDGALTTGVAGQSIEQYLVAMTKTFIELNDFVVFAIDAHNENDKYHPENKLYPSHNIEGSQGRQLFGSLNELYQNYQHIPSLYWINKRHYSAFSGTDLDIRLRERKISQVHLTGVCTDICVLHTAVDAYNLGYEIVIHKDAVASFDSVGHQWTLNHCKNTLGATIL